MPCSKSGFSLGGLYWKNSRRNGERQTELHITNGSAFTVTRRTVLAGMGASTVLAVTGAAADQYDLRVNYRTSERRELIVSVVMRDSRIEVAAWRIEADLFGASIGQGRASDWNSNGIRRCLPNVLGCATADTLEVIELCFIMSGTSSAQGPTARTASARPRARCSYCF